MSPELEAQRAIERDLCLRIIARDPGPDEVLAGTTLVIAYRESIATAARAPLEALVREQREAIAAHRAIPVGSDIELFYAACDRIGAAEKALLNYKLPEA